MTLHYTATAEDSGKKLFSILRYRLHLSTGLIKRLKHQTLMYVNGTPAYTNHIIAPGDKITLPLVGVSSPPSICSRVLFPEPDFPTMATNSPCPIWIFT